MPRSADETRRSMDLDAYALGMERRMVLVPTPWRVLARLLRLLGVR